MLRALVLVLILGQITKQNILSNKFYTSVLAIFFCTKTGEGRGEGGLWDIFGGGGGCLIHVIVKFENLLLAYFGITFPSL